LIRTSEYIKPYGCRDHVDVTGDAVLIEAIEEEHDRTPALITSTTALEGYRNAQADVLDAVGETRYYGNVRGSTRLADSRVGAVIGSNHFGDDFIQRWGAYAGKAVEHRGKGEDLTYGAFGDQILQHMREHETLQAALRFGRDGNGAVVYVHTDTLPEWVPLAGEGRVVETWSDGMRQVIRALDDEGTASAVELAAHPAVDIGEWQVLNVLDALIERGVVCRQRDPRDGRRAVWTADDLDTLPEHGDVELAAGTSGGRDGDEIHELARMWLYTWEFANSADEGEAGWSQNGSGAPAAGRAASRGANASLDPPD
jgi:hypothetical protein